VRITLAGRHDLAQHFVISATLAAWSGEPVADAIGLYKELDDARRGSGFSFVDLAADRAGTRFGEILARNPGRLAEQLASGLSEHDLLPSVGDLPEYLDAERFRREYESPNSPRFKAMTGTSKPPEQPAPLPPLIAMSANLFDHLPPVTSSDEEFTTLLGEPG
jgi:uncharacterized protein YfiM (DUF2279 family)